MKIESVKVNLKGCSRCGKNHRKILFKKFRNPGIFGWWAICPTTKEPLLLDTFKDAEKAEKIKAQMFKLKREKSLL